MKKDLTKTEKQIQFISSDFIHKALLAFIAVLPVLGGGFLLWVFLSSIGRNEIFQLIISDPSTAIMISIAYFIYILLVLYIIYLPAIVFYIYFGLYKKTGKETIPLIKFNFIISLILLFSIITTSYLSFEFGYNISSILAFIPYVIILLILMFLSKNIELTFLIALSSLPCVIPIALILNFIEDSGTIKSAIVLLSLCFLMSAITFTILYYGYKKSSKSCLVFIGCVSIIISTLIYSFIPNIFYRAFEKINIIDSSKYDLIVNKNDYPLDVFNDLQWLIETSSKDDNVYHVNGEKFFSLSKNVLFCPTGTFKDLKNSAIYNTDTWKPKVSSQDLKNQINKCVLLDANKVIFHKLL